MPPTSPRRIRRGPIIAEVNMTPLIDLTFLLLVAFMITFPALEQGITVKLPQANANPLPSQKAKTVSVKSDGNVYFGDTQTSMEELEVSLRKLVSENPETTILIRGDEKLDYGKIMQVVKVLYKANITRMALVTLAD